MAGIAAPSANRFGRVSATRAAHVEQEFGAALWVLDGGECPGGIESAIVDCTAAQPTLLRPGLLARAQIEAALGQALREPDALSPRASGTPGVALRTERQAAADAAAPTARGGGDPG